MPDEHPEREATIAEKVNPVVPEPGNPAGKPIADGTVVPTDDDEGREQVDESEHDDIWAQAEVTEHDPELAP